MLAQKAPLELITEKSQEIYGHLFHFLLEYGQLLNDTLALKLALISNGSLTREGLKQVLEEVNGIIFPGLSSKKHIVSKETQDLMKELEDTIVIFERKSLEEAKRSGRKRKMSIL